MDITPKFYLRDKKTLTATSIQLVLNFSNLKLKYGTGLRIKPLFWDEENFRPIQGRKATSKLEPSTRKELTSIKNKLDKITQLVKKRFAYLLEQEIQPTPNLLRDYLDESLEWRDANPIVKKQSLTEYFQSYIDEMKNGVRTTAGKRFAQGTIKNYEGCLNQFKEYQSKRRRKLKFESITMDFYNDFVKYFNDKGYSQNTIGRHIKNLKTIMRAALDICLLYTSPSPRD